MWSFQHPQLYVPGQLNQYFSKTAFFKCALHSVYSSVVLFFIPYAAMYDTVRDDGRDIADYQSFALLAQTCLVITVCIQVQYNTLEYSTIYYITVQYSTMNYITVKYIAVHYSTIHCSKKKHYITIHYNALHYSTMYYSTVQCITVQYNANSTVQCITLQYNALQYSNYSIVHCITVQ